jgi:NADH dehydrogenase [ubiquinone] 1 alpha subcomplex assembly factor 5
MNQILFDRDLLARRRARAAPRLADHDFLAKRAGEDIAARLAAIVRDFPVALCLGAQGASPCRELAEAGRAGMMIYADPCPRLLDRRDGPAVVCEEELLPFAAGSLDLVVSTLALHLVNDLPGTLIQVRRALKPDGLLLAAVLGGRTLSELSQTFTAAESEMEGGASPRVVPFADVRDYGALLQRAGFALPVTDADAITVTYASMFELMRDLRGMGATNMLASRTRKPLRRKTLFRAAEIYAERFPAEGGRIAATFEIIHMTGWAPDESQPKPRTPGSAQRRLADALGTHEISTGAKADPKRRG